MDGSVKSFKDSVKGGELFQGKVTRCTTAKSNLTKSLNSFDKCVQDFISSESPEIPLATRKRKARLVMEGMEKIELKGATLKETMQDFIVYLSGLSKDNFEAPATPTSIMVSANTDADEREKAMKDKLEEHELVIRRAVVLMATEIVMSQQVEGGSDISTFSTFRPQADLRPQILEKEATYKEALHFQEIRPHKCDSFCNYYNLHWTQGNFYWYYDVDLGDECLKDAEAAKLTRKQEKRKKERERKKEKVKLLKEAAKAAQSSDLNLFPKNYVNSSFSLEEKRMIKLNTEILSPNNSSSEMDSPRVFDQRTSNLCWNVLFVAVLVPSNSVSDSRDTPSLW